MIQLLPTFIFMAAEYLSFGYFMSLNVLYLMLSFISFFSLIRYMQERTFIAVPDKDSMFKPPISLLVPAYNEEKTIASSLRSLMQLNYAEYEVIIINDGSQDGTLKTLIQEFDLSPAPYVIRRQINTRQVYGVYYSSLFPNLKVVDKENGGKADALNVGLNVAQYPLVCCTDGDSILQKDSLDRIVQPFLQDSLTVAAGGTIRIVNGCTIDKGYRTKTALPTNWLALFQVMEYMRAFLFGRLGWARMNALLIVAGAFGLFRKDLLIKIGGYRSETLGEDMDLILRLHGHLIKEGKPYRIAFIPDPVCWTEVPEDFRTLRNQRIRWQRGLSESLLYNKKLLFNPRGKMVSWFSLPFHWVYEWFGPVVEFTATFLVLLGLLIGKVSLEAAGVFFLVTIGLGVLLSISALMLEEVSFHIYPKKRHLLMLFAVAILENLGYRQLNSLWRLEGLLQWGSGRRAQWGEMRRVGSAG